MVRAVTQATLSPAQVAMGLALAGLRPEAPSPLLDVALPPPTLDVAHPGFRQLVDRGLVLPRDDGWRANVLFASALAAAAMPDVVTRVQIDDGARPGIAVCRRGRFAVECTVGPLGIVNLAFPLSPALVARALAGPLGGPDREPSTRVHVRGDAAAVAALATLLRREHAGEPTPEAALVDAVRATALDGALFAPLALLGGGPGLIDLLDSPARVDAAIDRLVDDGHVRREDAMLRVSDELGAVLGSPATAGCSVARAVRGGGSSAFHLSRHGDETVLFRRTVDGAGSAIFEWSTIGRAAARALLAAAVLAEGELAPA